MNSSYRHGQTGHSQPMAEARGRRLTSSGDPRTPVAASAENWLKPPRRAAPRPGPSLCDMALAGELSALLNTALLLPGDTCGYLTDATEARGLWGHADAIVLPQ